MSDRKTKETEFTKKKFKVKLVRDYIYTMVKAKGKEIKRNLDKKIFYPFDK